MPSYRSQGDAGVLTKESAASIERVLDELYAAEHSMVPGTWLSPSLLMLLVMA
jgi:hypothetical protein